MTKESLTQKLEEKGVEAKILKIKGFENEKTKKIDDYWVVYTFDMTYQPSEISSEISSTIISSPLKDCLVIDEDEAVGAITWAKKYEDRQIERVVNG